MAETHVSLNPVAQSAAIADASAPVALTGATVTTAAATDLTTTEALANALKTAVNANVADLVALRALQAILVTKLNLVITALEVAGIIVTV